MVTVCIIDLKLKINKIKRFCYTKNTHQNNIKHTKGYSLIIVTNFYYYINISFLSGVGNRTYRINISWKDNIFVFYLKYFVLTSNRNVIDLSYERLIRRYKRNPP